MGLRAADEHRTIVYSGRTDGKHQEAVGIMMTNIAVRSLVDC